MIAAGASLVIMLVAVYCWARAKEPPVDRDVILRIRSLADQTRREELLPYE